MTPATGDSSLDHAFSGRGEFRDALRRLFAEGSRQGARELLCSDIGFADWPFDDRGVLESLTAWAKPHRRLVLLASNFDEVARRHPRWIAWRRVWSHVVTCRQADADIAPDDLATLLVAPGAGTLRLLDRVRHRGVVSTAAIDATRARSDFDALAQRSSEAFGATTLGL